MKYQNTLIAGYKTNYLVAFAYWFSGSTNILAAYINAISNFWLKKL
jgi:hypothetical protein